LSAKKSAYAGGKIKMMPESKTKGIDQREIACVCENPNCAEAGISFDGDLLLFHFLQSCPVGSVQNYHQVSKGMILNKKTRKQLIKALKQMEL
jgi:hypothetical protein